MRIVIDESNPADATIGAGRFGLALMLALGMSGCYGGRPGDDPGAASEAGTSDASAATATMSTDGGDGSGSDDGGGNGDDEGEEVGEDVPRLWRLTGRQYVNTINVLYTGRLIDETVELPTRAPGPYANRHTIDSPPPLDAVVPTDRYSTRARSYAMDDYQLEQLIETGARVAATLASFLVERELECIKQGQTPWGECLREDLQVRGTLLIHRPFTDEELDHYMAAAERAYAADGTAESAFAAAYEALLSSPLFVFRRELGRSPDFELAAALAYTLTDAPPDQVLWEAASAGTLRQPEVLEAQVRRLLTSPRQGPARRFLEEYFELQDGAGNNGSHRQLKAAQGLFRWLVQEHGEGDFFAELLTGTRWFIARNNTDVFDVEWPADAEGDDAMLDVDPNQRRGFLTHPSFAIAHAFNDRTDAVKRGRFIRESMLCGKIPDAPIDNIPPLDFSEAATMRDRLEIHTQGGCQTCHEQMDPLGLALEQYDRRGAFRTEDHGQPIDPSGTLEGAGEVVDGEFADGFELVDKLAQSAVTRRCFARNGFHFWLGREPDGPTDDEVIDAMTDVLTDSGSYVDMLATLLSSDSFVRDHFRGEGE